MVEFSPYAYALHQDPHPLDRRLRGEAPLDHNAEGEFWALSRRADALVAFTYVSRFSNAQGVSIDPAARGPGVHSVNVRGFSALPSVPGVRRGA